MIFQILKKDMMKRKGVNVILFLFITLATVFLSSSVNNILIVSSAVDYYIDYAHVPDVSIFTNSEKENAAITAWLDEEKKSHKINAYSYDTLQGFTEKALRIDKKNEVLNSEGDSLYFTTLNENYNKVFNQDGKTFTLNKGEIAVSIPLMEQNHLQIGDTFTYQEHNISKTFTIKTVTKDAAFGNSMVGMRRFIVSNEDYEEIVNENTKYGLYYIESDQPNEFSKSLDAKEFNSILNVVTKDTYKMVYSFDMVIAALLILIGVCLILIALLVLRFTLIFTIEEQYQEIGILKAIGLRNYSIKKLYLVKYLAIVSIASLLGLCISIPVSNIMIQSVSENMIMASNDINISVNLLCSLFIIMVVMLFCYISTSKLNKVSAITAIHGGENGERYHKRRGLRLHRHLKMPVSLFLGCNDIGSHLRRYMVLIVTFCISFILITIPLNTLNTITSKEMITKFQLNPKSAAYVRQIELASQGSYDSIDELKKGMQRVEKELKTHGYEASLTGEAIHFLKIQRDDGSNRKLMSLQIIGPDDQFSEYSKGSRPKLENEIAISSMVMEQEGLKIGDTISVLVGGEYKKMIITATYSDYMQLGESVRLNSKIDTSKEVMFDYWSVMVNMETDLSQEEMVKELRTIFPDYEWSDAQSLINQNVGSVQDVLKQLVVPMTIMLCLIIMLITLLMEKLFITREKSEIAMMKSMGFKYQNIRNWQIIRMSVVVLTSMVISIPLSLISNQFVLKPIFAIMGAVVNIQVDIIQVYIVYPCLLFIGIIIATLLAVKSVKKIDIREMNNLE